MMSANKLSKYNRVQVDRLRTPWVPAPAKSSGANIILPSSIGVTLPRKKLETAKAEQQHLYGTKCKSTISSTEENSTVIRKSEQANTKMETSSSNHNVDQTAASIKEEPKHNVRLYSRNTNSSNHTRKQRRSHVPRLRHIHRPSTSHPKKIKQSQRRGIMHSFKESKDSLTDVTACLQEKRQQVLKLWEKNILKGDPDLLSGVENANRLALEAAEEVENLRRTIQNLQKKKEGLSDTDCNQLEQMRMHVLGKVRQFEEADNLLQDKIAKKSIFKMPFETSKTSQTEVISNERTFKERDQSATCELIPEASLPDYINQVSTKKSPSNKLIPSETLETQDVIILKQRPSFFPEDSECETNAFDRKEETYTYNDAGIQKRLDYPYPSRGEFTLEKLSRLKLLYEKNADFPSLHKIFTLNDPIIDTGGIGDTDKCDGTETFTKSNVNPTGIVVDHLNNHKSREVRLDEERIRVNEQHELFSSSKGDMYREEISTLQRHLLNTEHEVEELKSEMERIESDANFRVRILQNSVQDKFESLQIIPDYLQLLDQKLSESVQEKVKLLNAIESKEKVINEMKEQNKNDKRERDDLREQLRRVENCNDFLSFKNIELEKSNTELRKQVDDLTKQVADMSCQIMIMKGNESTPTIYKSRLQEDLSLENEKLKLQCLELKEKIIHSKKIIQTLRKSKTKMVLSLNNRIEELMDSLQQAQHHKRILGDQIRHLRKSYHEMFPVDMFKTGNTMQSSRKQSNMNTKRFSMKSKEKIVDEPKIHPSVAYKTGGDGIKLDDLLQVQLP